MRMIELHEAAGPSLASLAVTYVGSFGKVAPSASSVSADIAKASIADSSMESAIFASFVKFPREKPSRINFWPKSLNRTATIKGAHCPTARGRGPCRGRGWR